MQRLFIALCMAALALPVAAQSSTLQNLDKNGLALQGYDPVTYFTQGQPVKGRPEFTASHEGALYRFASGENRDLFKAAPEKYEPQFGGFCAYAVSRGYTARIDPVAFQIVDGRLLLQYSRRIRDKFNEDTRGNLSKADTNWPAIVEKGEK